MLVEGGQKSVEIFRQFLFARRGQSEAKLEPTAYGTVLQFGMVGGGDDDGIARQFINMHQQRCDNAFDFPGFVDITEILSDSVEFIEEQDAERCTYVVENTFEQYGGFAEIAADHVVVAHHEERSGKRSDD